MSYHIEWQPVESWFCLECVGSSDSLVSAIRKVWGSGLTEYNGPWTLDERAIPYLRGMQAAGLDTSALQDAITQHGSIRVRAIS